jgi:hypothetical protein
MMEQEMDTIFRYITNLNGVLKPLRRKLRTMEIIEEPALKERFGTGRQPEVTALHMRIGAKKEMIRELERQLKEAYTALSTLENYPQRWHEMPRFKNIVTKQLTAAARFQGQLDSAADREEEKRQRKRAKRRAQQPRPPPKPKPPRPPEASHRRP